MHNVNTICKMGLVNQQYTLELNLQSFLLNYCEEICDNHEKIYQHFSKKAPNRFFSFLLIFVQKGLNILTMQMVSIGTVENDTFF